MPRGYWTCQRSSQGVRCRAVNPNRARKCKRCQKARPARKRPAHMRALDVSYEQYVERFGETCGICGKPPTAGKKLRRDHDHKGAGEPRGLLCWRHNLGLQTFGDDPEYLRAAADYLERAA